MGSEYRKRKETDTYLEILRYFKKRHFSIIIDYNHCPRKQKLRARHQFGKIETVPDFLAKIFVVKGN